MKKIIVLISLLLAIPSFAMVEFDGATPTTASISGGDLEALGLTTILFHINPDTITGASFVILYFSGNLLEPQVIYINNSTLVIETETFCPLDGCNNGAWTVPISANTDQLVCIQWDMSNVNTDDPTVYINGTSQTVTELSTPNSASNNSAGRMYLGANVSSGSPFDGDISMLAIYVNEIGNTPCDYLTEARTKIAPHDLGGASLKYYWRLDEKTLGTISSKTSYPQSATNTTTTIDIYDAVANPESFLSK